MPAARPGITLARRQATQEYHRVPQKTKADDPAYYYKTPHDYGDVLIAGGKLGGALQRDLLYWIGRRTIGDKKRPEYAKISLSEFAKLCQSWDRGKLRPVERKSVAVALADLEKRGIIEARDRAGCGKTVAKMYRLAIENWKKAKPYEPPTPKEIEAAEAEADETADADIPVSEPEPGSISVVAPGRVSKPQPVSVSPSKGAPRVTLRVSYHSECEIPLSLRARPGANGRLQVTISPVKGEIEAKNCSRPQPQLKQKFVDSKRVQEFSDALCGLSTRIWGKVLDSDFTAQIVAAAGEADAQTLLRVCNNKFRRYQRPSEKFSSGILLVLAKDAAELHNHVTRQRAEAKPDPGTKPTAAELKRWSECIPCDATGKKGTWDHGKFTPGRQACPECKGTGIDPQAAAELAEVSQ